ncbi:MAG: hypothetical protein ACOCRK_00770 [bacterium]
MKKELQDLVFIGRIEETVKVLGKEWKMVTLNSDEHLGATNNSGKYNDTLSRLYAMKIEFLSRAIKSVSGIPFDDVDEAKEFLSEAQPTLVNRLYDKYEELQQKQNESLKDLDEIKN